MIKPITRDLVSDWENSIARSNNLEAEIVDRIDYIIKTLHLIFNIEYDYWCFSSHERDEGLGQLEMDMDHDMIYVHVYYKDTVHEPLK